MSSSMRVATIMSHLNMNQTAATEKKPVSIVSRDGGVAVIQINFPPVNSFHPSVQQGIQETFKEANQDASVKSIVLTGTGANFMAGADIEYIRSMQQSSSASVSEVAAYCRTGNLLFNSIESSSKPVVAAVNGTAFGGGLELSMVCHARVTVATAQFGLPELTLGIIPGLGGTQRLPRLIGVQRAVDLTLSSKPIKAPEALKLGLVDQIVKPDELIGAARKLALAIASNAVPRRVSLTQTSKLSPSIDADLAYIEMARVTAIAKSKVALPHIGVFCDAVKTGLQKGGLAGIDAEIDGLSRLVLGPVSRSLIHFFFASRATTKVPGVPSKLPAGSKPIRNVAVIGGGTMGAGIAIVYLSSGHNVILKEMNDQLLAAAVKRIVEQLQRVIKARKLPTMALEALMRNLTPQTNWDGFSSVDLVVEAIVENVAVKQALFVELEARCPKHAILATNTSTIDVELIGAKTTAQDRIIGLHYFSPAHVMPLLEIVRTKLTSATTVAASLAMSKKIGKTPVVVGNCVGFVANRVFFPYGQSASLLADAGVSPYRIDAALEKFGMPMGVFRMFDLSGVDIGVHVSGQMNGAYGGRCYNSSLGKLLFNAGRLGQKTGVGYYRYAAPGAKPVKDNSALDKFLAQSREDAKKAGLIAVDEKTLTDTDIVEMVLYPIVNECARTLGEGFALSAGDIDVCSVMGYGFPSSRGGVMFYGSSSHQGNGYARVVDRLTQFANKFASNPAAKNFFQPSKELIDLANKQKKN